METNKMLAHSLETEALLLGSLMCLHDEFHEVAHLLNPQCFYDPFHRQIYEIIVRLHEKGYTPDLLTIRDELTRSDPETDISRLLDISGRFTSNLYLHACVLAELSQRRQLAETALQLYHKADDEQWEVSHLVTQTIEQLGKLTAGPDTEFRTLDDAIGELRKQVEKNYNSETALTGSPTGLQEFDRKGGGLQKSDLIVIAADTSQGKTSLAMSVALHAARTGAGVAIYSLEMKNEQIAARLLAVESNIPVNTLLYSRLANSQLEEMEKGLSRLYGLPVWFDDRATSHIDTIIASIRSLKIKFNIQGAVVDYLQILNINMKDHNKEAQMGEVSRRLKNLARELDIWIIALSQLNRDANNPIPSVSRLRDSGQIGEAADIIMLIYRPQVYGRTYPEPFTQVSPEGTAMIHIAKGRNIGMMKFICGFDTHTTRFYPLETVPSRQKDKEEEPF